MLSKSYAVVSELKLGPMSGKGEDCSTGLQAQYSQSSTETNWLALALHRKKEVKRIYKP